MGGEHLKPYIRLLRPKHALKNLLIFLPLVFGGALFDAPVLQSAVCGFVAFCCLASVVYIINDICDAPRDRLHPTKKTRPIASGAVSPMQAAAEAAVLLAVMLLLSFWCNFPLESYLCLAIYFAVNIGYSLGLKNVPILDIALLVSGFLLRVLFGAAVTGIAISDWLYLTVIAISFYLGLGKRRGELARQKGDTRKVLKYYTYDYLDKYMQISLGLSITFYALWSMGAANGMVWTVPLVICLCMKYSLTVEGDSDGDPVEVICRDKILLALAAAFAALVLSILYLF